MSGGRHHVTYICPLVGEGMAVAWSAVCSCGASSADDGVPDGTMDSARRWRDAHWVEMCPQGPRPPVSLPLDEPDPAADSYDAFLRGATGG